jgi:16S rRNA (cytosine1402-N4)-methyltransferase
VPAFEHKPVLLEEALRALQPRPGGFYVDGTVGGGGHAWAVLAASAPKGRLFGCDRDPVALEAAARRLGEFAGRFELRQANYADLATVLEAGSAEGVLLDLGVSSPQLDEAERGFSFLREGPLDMRMDPTRGQTAADLINHLPVSELAAIFYDFGEEPMARRVARAIDEERSRAPLLTTTQLASLIERVSPRRGRRVHPATRVFQALRIAVNDELGALERGLVGALQVLRPGGRLAVISFHSLEDRIVKHFGRHQSRDYEFDGEVDVPELRRPKPPTLRLVNRKAVEPSAAEREANPRSRSARLRVMEKC